jgi:hypothetical protein
LRWGVGACTLIAYIDDATSRIQHAAFASSESTLDYLRKTQTYVSRYGRPIAFYSDKHAIFRVNKRGRWRWYDPVRPNVARAQH